MKIGNINADEDHVKYVGQIYQKHYVRLRSYFLAQLDNSSEADDCVLETIRSLFFFMEDRDWEADAEYIHVYLMRIAGFLCSRKLSEKRAQRVNNLNALENKSAFNKVRIIAGKIIKEGIEWIKAFLRLLEGNSKRSSSM